MNWEDWISFLLPWPQVTFAVLFYLPEGKCFWITGLINKVNTDGRCCADRVEEQRSSWGDGVWGQTVDLRPGRTLAATVYRRGSKIALQRGRISTVTKIYLDINLRLIYCKETVKTGWKAGKFNQLQSLFEVPTVEKHLWNVTYGHWRSSALHKRLHICQGNVPEHLNGWLLERSACVHYGSKARRQRRCCWWWGLNRQQMTG